MVVADTVDLSPEFPVVLGCNGYPNIHVQNIHDRPEANILLIRDQMHSVVIVSLDALYPSDISISLRSLLRNHVEDEHLFIAASHSHQCPATDSDKPNLGRADPEYIRYASTKIAAAIIAMTISESGCAGTVAVRDITLPDGLAVSRRKKMPLWFTRKMRLSRNIVARGPAPHVKIDPFLSIAEVADAQGKIVAILWTLAVHPVSYPNPLEMSADYPGLLRGYLRATYGQQVPVLFFQGFSGDIRPFSHLWSHVWLGNWRQRIARHVFGLGFPQFSREGFLGWSARLWEVMESELPIPEDQRASIDIEARRAVQSIPEVRAENSSASVEVSVHRVRMSNSFTLYGISAEAVSNLRSVVLNVFTPGDRVIWTIGCIDRSYGYIAAKEMVIEGGYEVDGWAPAFGCQGRPQFTEAAMVNLTSHVAD